MLFWGVKVVPLKFLNGYQPPFTDNGVHRWVHSTLQSPCKRSSLLVEGSFSRKSEKNDFVFCANPKAMENEQDRPYNSFTYNQMQTSGKPQEIGIHHWASKSKIKGCIVMNALKWKASARSQKKNLLHLPRYSLREKIWTRR